MRQQTHLPGLTRKEMRFLVVGDLDNMPKELCVTQSPQLLELFPRHKPSVCSDCFILRCGQEEGLDTLWNIFGNEGVLVERQTSNSLELMRSHTTNNNCVSHSQVVKSRALPRNHRNHPLTPKTNRPCSLHHRTQNFSGISTLGRVTTSSSMVQGDVERAAMSSGPCDISPFSGRWKVRYW